jgi:hypothetical protein
MTLAPISDMGRWISVLAPAAQLAERIAGTEFVPAAMRGKPDVVTACIMYGDEIGIGPMQALASIHVVEGRPQPSAELMRAMILRAGHSFVVEHADTELVRVSGRRADEPETARLTITWDLGQARQAGLLSRQNWVRYPRAMLLARASGDLARLKFPDVIKGLGYVAEDQPEDLESWAGQAAEAPAPQPALKRITRKPAQPPDVPIAPPVDRQPTQPVPLPEAVPQGEPEPTTLDPWAQVDVAEPPAPVAPPAEPPAAPPNAIGERMRRALMAQLSRIGIDHAKDRDMSLALMSALINRPVDSSKHLSRSDGLMLMRLLNDIETGALDWEYDTSSGQVHLARYRQE